MARAKEKLGNLVEEIKEAATTFTITAGNIVVQEVRNNLNQPASSNENHWIKVLNNQVFIGSKTSRILYISSNTSFTDYTNSTPRVTGEGAQLILDQKTKTREKTMFYKNLGLKIGVIGIFGLLSPVIVYHGYLLIEGISGMMVNITTGTLPRPPARPPKFLRDNILYGPLVKGVDKRIVGMEKEFEEYLKTGKHPLAVFPFPKQ